MSENNKEKDVLNLTKIEKEELIGLSQDFPSVKLKIRLKISNLPKSSFYEWVKKLEIVNQEELPSL